jgi:hypothetical protein
MNFYSTTSAFHTRLYISRCPFYFFFLEILVYCTWNPRIETSTVWYSGHYLRNSSFPWISFIEPNTLRTEVRGKGSVPEENKFAEKFPEPCSTSLTRYGTKSAPPPPLKRTQLLEQVRVDIIIIIITRGHKTVLTLQTTLLTWGMSKPDLVRHNSPRISDLTQV